jgi:hypothetical protein
MRLVSRPHCSDAGEYVRAMQSLIAASSPGQCVGLYGAQPLDLSAVENVLAA